MKYGYSIRVLTPAREYYILGISTDGLYEGVKNPKAAKKKEAVKYMNELITKLKGVQEDV